MSLQSHSTGGRHSSNPDRAKILLGAGVPIDKIALTLGISPSTIASYLKDEEFKAEVEELKYGNLQEQNDIDDGYRKIEKKLQEKLGEMVEYICNPGQLLAALRIVNGTVRRGVSAPVQQQDDQRQVVSLNIPISVQQTFVTNINNQVIKAGDKELVTVQSHKMRGLLEGLNTRRIENEPSPTIENAREIREVREIKNVEYSKSGGTTSSPQSISNY